MVGLITLCVIYFIAMFCEFLAPYDPGVVQPKRLNLPPQAIHFISEKGFTLRPFVYGLKQGYDKVTLKAKYEIDTAIRYHLRLFATR